MGNGLQHPCYEYLDRLVASILRCRRFDGVSMNGVKYDFFTGTYTLALTHLGATTTVSIPNELLDEIYAGTDNFQRTRMKRLLKTALRWNDVDVDEDD